MSRCARERRVFFFEEPIVDGEELTLEVHEAMPNLFVCTPHLPQALAQQPQDIVESAQRQLLHELLLERDVNKPIVWFYTPMALPLVRGLDMSLVVYDAMDELSAFRGAPPALLERERELFALADIVFTGGQSLYEAKRTQHRAVYAFPSSVDAAHFSRARDAMEDTLDQRDIGRPRVGFFGVIDERLDLELLAKVAQERPDYEFIMIGPVVKIDQATLPQRDNIHYLGSKSYPDLPRYLAGWQVAMMPFALNEATRFISPTKTLEYLAAGRPVVSTAIRDVVKPYGEQGLVRIADASTFARAIDDALAEELDVYRKRCDEVLARTSWDKTWAAMIRLMKEARSSRSGIGMSERTAQSTFDYLIVGAGFAGSVLAERLAHVGKRVLICDKRPHIGGNAYDHHDDSGVLVHKYGPHIFHTGSPRISHYLSRFTSWRQYEHRVLASVEGKLLPFPINVDTLNKLYGTSMSSEEAAAYFERVAEKTPHAHTSEDAVVSKIGRDLYEKFFRNYTRKQWGLDPSELDAAVAARVPARTNFDDRYFTDDFQAMPRYGYTRMFENMLDHKNITIALRCDYRDIRRAVRYEKTVYTGAIDAFFDHRYGKLPYRSLDFKFETHDKETFQQAAVVNYPNEHAYTRITEFKYLTGQQHHKTSVCYEYPTADGDPYYPVPRAENADLYRRYKALADATPHVHFVGRLATYRYYNMDQVVGQALAMFEHIRNTETDDESGDNVLEDTRAA